MKLIESIFLRFKDDSSDKEYKAEIFEQSPDNYIVNFAFGKSGSTLKDNTKTPKPVSLNEAQKIYHDLVNSKTKKGYKKIRSFNINDIAKESLKNNPDKQIQEVIKKLSSEYISSLNLNDEKRNQLIGRYIWRAGELKVKEALPSLVNLLSSLITSLYSKDNLIKYSLIWSIGHCSEVGNKEVTNLLKSIFDNPRNLEIIKRIATEAYLKIADIEEKKDIESNKINSLPSNLKDLLNNQKYVDFNFAYNLYISKPEHFNSTFETLYYIDNDHVRQTLINALKMVPLKANYFKSVRHIFKIAEYRADAEVFGIIAKRFEKEKSNINNVNSYYWNSNYNWASIQTDIGYFNATEIKNDLEKPNSRFAYTQKTKEYMLKRVIRNLRKLGEDNNPDFVKMAVGVLLAYQDSDAVLAKETSKTFYNYETRRSYTKKSSWDKFAPFQAFNYLLYTNSQRYGKEENSKAWKCINKYKSGDPEPESREEAFPQLWNNNPAGLIHLLAESQCEEVHNFAVKALRELKEIWLEIDNETLIFLLEKPYNITAEFAFELIKNRYNPNNPDSLLIQALINSVSIKAREQGLDWINENKEYYLNNEDFLISLMTSEYDNVREFIKNSNFKLSDKQNEIIIVKLISYLITKVKDYKKAFDMSENLKVNYKLYLRNIGINIINDLLHSDLEPIQDFGAFLFENHNNKIEDMPYQLLQLMIDSNFESVRSVGVNLIGQLPKETAILRIPLIISLATNKLADIRMETRTIIEKLISDTNLGEKITEELITHLLIKENYENLHLDIVYLLNNQLRNFTNNLDLDAILLLIDSKSKEAQELGGNLLNTDKNIKLAISLEIIEIVKLTNHEILSVRESAWNILNYHAKEIINDRHKLPKVMRFFDSKKEDSRLYARNTFSQHFKDEDWSTELLIGLCDSLFIDVRIFGKSLIEKMFKSENALEYLTKLSEHPTTDMQLFATNYIKEYASNDIDKIKELIPYFKRVLANINKSRTAKNKILEFLKDISQKDIEIAKIVNQIIYWYSATNSVEDKAKSIEVLAEINLLYPQLDNLESSKENNEFNNSFGKLKIKEVEIRSRN